MINLTVISAQRAASTLKALFPRDRIRVDAHANAVVIIGPPDDVQQMRTVIQGIDVRNPDTPTTEIIPLHVLKAQAIAPRLRALYPRAHIEVASKTTQWTTPDVYQGDITDPMTSHAYTWNRNNSLEYSDPSGYSAVFTPVFQPIICGPQCVQTAVKVIGIVAAASTRAVPLIAGAAAILSLKGDSGPSPTGASTPPVPGATQEKVTGSGTEIWSKPGDGDDAEKDFGSLGPTNVRTYSNGTTAGDLPDGATVNVRRHSSDGRPTLEIQRKGKPSIKVRYTQPTKP